MPIFNLRTIPQILSDAISKVTAETDITDINGGSVTLTFLESVALEAFNGYIQMLNLILNYNLDNLKGSDLDARAFEYGILREQSRKASGYVSFTDTAFKKIQTTIYSGLNGPSAGSGTVNVTSVTGFPVNGNIILGRNTNNIEVVTYDSITPIGSYYRLNLNVGTPLTKDHGTDETVILSQGGNRTIPAGTVVYAPAGDTSDRIDYVTQTIATILDGETTVDNNTVIAVLAGSAGNVGNGRINSFSALPFSTATVTNPQGFSSGRDVEIDSVLIQRIKDAVQSLSKGTITAILFAISQVESVEQQNKVLSSKFLEATTLNTISHLYSDDGNGLEPLIKGNGYELVLNRAAGTERFLHLDTTTTPLAKAALISQNESPYNIPAGYTLTFSINGIEETITFGGTTDFADPTQATAQEIVVAMNNRLNLIEARTLEGRKKIVVQAKASFLEDIKLVSGNANDSIGFIKGVTFYTLKLYKNDILLNKDGENAFVETGNFANFAIPNPSTLTVIVDGKTTNVQTINFTTESTAQNVVDTINAQLSGALATVTTSVNGSKVRITSTNPTPGASSIRVTGGNANSAGANPLNFSTVLVSGKAKDYTLNRFNGQIELVNPLVAEDEISAGSPYTRAYIESTVANNYTIAIGQLLIFQIDDIVDSSVTTNISTTNFRDASLVASYTIDNHFKGLYVRFKDTTATAALRGQARLISAYDHTNGQITTAAFTNVPAIGDTYEIVQILTVAANQNLSASDMADYLNLNLTTIGGSFYAKQKGNGDTYLRLQTNTQGPNGKVRVLSASTTVGLAMLSNTTKSNQESNYAYVESGNEQDFTVGHGQSLIVILDKDPANKTYSLPMDVPGTVTTQTSTTHFNALALVTPYPLTNFFTNFRVRFRDNTTTVALRGQIRAVSAYNGVTGELTTSAFTNSPAVGDTFDLIPTTAKNVVDLFNASGYSSFGSFANIQTSTDGTKVQISSNYIGSTGGVQIAGGTANNFSIPLLTDGTAGGQCTVGSIDGISVGLQLYIKDDNSAASAITITNITGAASPYTVTVTVDAGGTDISAFTVPQNAVLTDRNQFNFDTSPITGIDGYEYYGGLIQQEQWTLNGQDTDPINYPGVAAAGVQIEVAAPILTFVTVIVQVTTIGSLAVSAVTNPVKAVIGQYINSLGVGAEVILAEITKAVMGVDGVVDVKITFPINNIVIQDNELAKVRDSDIYVS